MLSALSSYIWGTEQDEATEIVATTKEPIDEHVELENDWIFVRPNERKPRRRAAHFDDAASTTSDASSVCGMEESWLVTPPQCFNGRIKRNRTEVSPMENLLIEHPSMFIYHESEEVIQDEATETTKETAVANRRDTHKPIAGRLQVLEKRQPLKDLNKKPNDRKYSSPKSIKRRNQVYVRQHGSRKNKQYGRMVGKHVGMVGNRGY